MLFNSALISEIRKKRSIRQADFAKRLAVSESYLSMIETGQRMPSLEFIEKLVDATDIPVEKWLSANPHLENKEISYLTRNEARMDMKQRLNREHRQRQKAEERVWELEEINEHLMAETRLHEHFEDILCAESLSKSEKIAKLKKLAVLTMEEGELCFDEIQRVLKVERSILRNWLEAEKRPYECRFVDEGRILAFSPGEAALCLRCFDCEAFESGECLGYGNEKRPENIVEILVGLRKNGVYDGASQAQILEKYYGISLSARDISNIQYRYKNNLPIPDDVFFLDTRK